LSTDKVCQSCHKSNPGFAERCFHCLAPLPASATPPAKIPSADGSTPAAGAPWIVLTTPDGDFFAARDGDIIGRTGIGHELLNPHEGISRKHVQFVRKRDEWFVIDLNSSNGTFLDGRRISPKALTPIRNGQQLGFSPDFVVAVSFEGRQPEISTAADIDADANRQTLVILFADIKGSVDFFQEMGTIVARNWILKLFRMLTAVIAIHEGRHLKNIGDAILAVFPDACEAAKAAREMQSIIHEYNKSVEPSQAYSIRIGMNIGSVLFENNDVFGNAVNIASRVQDLTPPGRIFITRELFAAIGPDTDIVTEFIGEEVLKGVRQTTGIYEVIAPHIADNKNTRVL